MSEPHDPYTPQQGGQPSYGQPQYGPPQQGGQPQYGQPQYGPPQYGPPQQGGQPQYGQPQYGQPQYGYPPGQFPPAPQQSRKKTWIITGVAGVVLIAVVIALVAVFAGSNDHSADDKTAGRTVALPESFGSYKKLDSVNTGSLRSQIAGQLSSLGAGSSAADNAKVGAYSTNGSTPQVVFLGFRVKDVPKLQSQLKDMGTSDTVKQFTDGVAKGVTGQGGSTSGGPKAYSAGKLGGAMRCQAATLSGQAVGVCGWGDQSYFALTLLIGQSSASTAADVTRQLREAAEH